MFDNIWKIYRNRIDKYIFYIKLRWLLTIILLSIYIYRLIIIGGYYVISYIMGLYILHLSVQFFQPLGLPNIEDEETYEDNVYEDLPITTNMYFFINFVNLRFFFEKRQGDDNFKPLIRSISEFKFWQMVTFAIILSIGCTYVSFLDLPVFWPFLLLYFLVLVFLTFKRMLVHMNKFNYGFVYDSNKKIVK